MNKALWSLVAGLVVLLALVFTTDGGSADFTLFLGRFHPLLVHLPIGILLLALLLEGLARRPGWGAYGKAVTVTLYVGAWSAILAAAAGLFLAQGGGYDADTLAWHKRLGVLTALLAAAAFLLKVRAPSSKRMRRGYAAALAALLLSVSLGGHLGGRLTHGDGYLTRYMPDALRALAGLPPKADIGRLAIDNLEDASAFSVLIQPVLEDRCVACHNPNKTKGGLLLDTPENILEGGDDGPVLVPGRAGESELIRRIWLPQGHEDHMPPDGTPLTVAQAELIRWWIDQGASFEQTLADVEIPPTVRSILDAYGLDEIRTGIFALDVPPPDTSAVRALRSLGLTVTPLAEDEPFLQVGCADRTACLRREQADALRSVASQVAWLDLGRAQVTDSLLAVLSSLENLTRLHLEHTAVTDAGLTHLDALAYLEYLNLYGTAVGDDGLQHLAALPGLKALYLWQTNVTDAGVERLQQALPRLEIDRGWTPITPVSQADSTAE